MANEVVELRRPASELQAAQPATNLPSVVTSIMAQLATAITEMAADDVSLELTSHADQNCSQTRFSFRACRRGRVIAEENG